MASETCSIFNPFLELALFFKEPGPRSLTPAPCEERVNIFLIYLLFLCVCVLGWVSVWSQGVSCGHRRLVSIWQPWIWGLPPFLTPFAPSVFTNHCSFASSFPPSMYSRLVTDFPSRAGGRIKTLGRKGVPVPHLQGWPLAFLPRTLTCSRSALFPSAIPVKG